MADIFPDPITTLPEADIPLPGMKAFLSQADTHQVLFMQFDEDVGLPPHAHGAQVGFVLEGKIDLIMDGKQKTFCRGDRYFIPEGVVHSGKIHAGYADILNP